MLEDGGLGGDLVAAVERDGIERRFLGAQFAAFTDAVTAVGVGQKHPLVLGQHPHQHPDRVEVGAGGVLGVLVADRRADEGGQGNDDVGVLEKGFDRFLYPGVAFHHIEPGMMADPGEAGLGVHKIVEHGDPVARMQEQRYHHRAQVPGAAGDQNFVTLGHYSLIPQVHSARHATVRSAGAGRRDGCRQKTRGHGPCWHWPDRRRNHSRKTGSHRGAESSRR